MKLILLSVIVLAFSSSALSAYKGSISFSNSEISNHRRSAWTLSNVAANCLARYKTEHEQFYKQNCWRTQNGEKKCLSKFYGDRRYSMRRGSLRSDGKPLEYLPDALRKSGIPARLAGQMKQISCVGLALQCLKEGFNATNQQAQWRRIRSFVSSNGVGGTSLQYALGKIGWKTYYWNPAPYWSIEEDMRRWDREEKNWKSKGWHFYRYNRVMNRGTYWFNNVDDANELVGFQDKAPRILKKFPFWVGTAHTGYHVFPGTEEKVVEAHSTRHFTSFKNLEFSDFNPLKTGGGPRWTKTEKYRSGLIALPPMN
jgi:hypothetical protein